MTDWLTILMILAGLLIVIAIVLSIASFFIRLYMKLVKLIVHAGICIAAIVIVAIVAIAVWYFYLRPV